MSRRTLVTIIAVPLFFAFLALVALVRLDGSIVAFENQSEQMSQHSDIAIKAIDSGHLAPSPEQVSTVLKANAKALEADRNLVASLWTIIKLGAWIAVLGSIAHVSYCFVAYRSAQHRGSGSDAL